MPDRPPAKPTPWWGRILAGTAIGFAIPSFVFPLAEVAIQRRPHVPPGGSSLDSVFVLTGGLAPFLTPVALLLGLIVLLVPGIRIGLRVTATVIVAASVPATLHILRAFTAQFR